MVHGGLSVYRISRLIKYSFYKNIAFAFMLLYFQFFSGWSGAPPSEIRLTTIMLSLTLNDRHRICCVGSLLLA